MYETSYKKNRFIKGTFSELLCSKLDGPIPINDGLTQDLYTFRTCLVPGAFLQLKIYYNYNYCLMVHDKTRTIVLE
jgi:hypothetical protein